MFEGLAARALRGRLDLAWPGRLGLTFQERGPPAYKSLASSLPRRTAYPLRRRHANHESITSGACSELPFTFEPSFRLRSRQTFQPNRTLEASTGRPCTATDLGDSRQRHSGGPSSFERVPGGETIRCTAEE